MKLCIRSIEFEKITGECFKLQGKVDLYPSRCERLFRKRCRNLVEFVGIVTINDSPTRIDLADPVKFAPLDMPSKDKDRLKDLILDNIQCWLIKETLEKFSESKNFGVLI